MFALQTLQKLCLGSPLLVGRTLGSSSSSSGCHRKLRRKSCGFARVFENGLYDELQQRHRRRRRQGIWGAIWRSVVLYGHRFLLLVLLGVLLSLLLLHTKDLNLEGVAWLRAPPQLVPLACQWGIEPRCFAHSTRLLRGGVRVFGRPPRPGRSLGKQLPRDSNLRGEKLMRCTGKHKPQRDCRLSL